MTRTRIKTEGFGVPVTPPNLPCHCFTVEISLDRSIPVRITENFSVEENSKIDTRVEITRKLWDSISKALRDDFTLKLNEKKIKTGRWASGINRVDKVLGKEMCVLAWTVEQAINTDEINRIVDKWTKLSSEERWWLFRMIAVNSGSADQKNLEKGWKRAVYIALSE